MAAGTSLTAGKSLTRSHGDREKRTKMISWGNIFWRWGSIGAATKRGRDGKFKISNRGGNFLPKKKSMGRGSQVRGL